LSQIYAFPQLEEFYIGLVLTTVMLIPSFLKKSATPE